MDGLIALRPSIHFHNIPYQPEDSASHMLWIMWRTPTKCLKISPETSACKPNHQWNQWPSERNKNIWQCKSYPQEFYRNINWLRVAGKKLVRLANRLGPLPPLGEAGNLCKGQRSWLGPPLADGIQCLCVSPIVDRSVFIKTCFESLSISTTLSAPRLFMPNILIRVYVVSLTPTKFVNGLHLITIGAAPHWRFPSLCILDDVIWLCQNNRHLSLLI